jgi:hypothetical protein
MAFGDVFQKMVPVKVEAEEAGRRKDRLVEVSREFEQVEAEKKTANTGFNKALEDLRQERRKILNVLATGVEEREVDVIERLNEQVGCVETVRCDTGAVLPEFTRDWTAEERQRTVDEAIAENQARQAEAAKAEDAKDAERRKDAKKKDAVNTATGESDEAPL